MTTIADKILLLGASGLIGSYLFKELSKEREVIGTYASHRKTGLLHFDLSNPNLDALPLHGVKYGIICSAMTKIDACANNADLSNKVNVEGIERTLGQMIIRNITPVFFSSASVFAGVNGGYNELDDKCPTTLYGRQKAEVEDFLDKGHSLIIRPGKVFGLNSGEGVLFKEWFMKYLTGSEIRCADDERLSPTYVVDVARGTKALLDKDSRGIYNLNPPISMSRYEMAVDFFSHLGIKDANLKRCSIDDFHAKEKIPRKTFLDASKFIKETGFEFTSLKSCYDAIRSQYPIVLKVQDMPISKERVK